MRAKLSRAEKKARDADYYAANKDRICARNAAYRARNPEKVRANKAAYCAAEWAARNPDRVKSTKALCHQARVARNPENVKAAARRNSRRHALKRFGLTPEQYDSLVAAQGGCCCICRTDSPSKHGVFVVDHDHATGAVRGLLCVRCNTGIGMLGDDPEMLRRAMAYLWTRAAKAVA